MTKSIRLAATALSLLGMLAASPAAAQNTATVGGTGGNAYSLRCAAGQVLAGIDVFGGGWIDWIVANCVTPGGDGSWQLQWLGVAAGSAGVMHPPYTHWQPQCPEGYAVRGFQGTAGIYLNSISLRCYKLTSPSTTNSTMRSTGTAGGSGGTAYGTLTCSGSKPAVGVRGKAGQYIDSFGLICG
jgi:hypothetical protein